MAKLIIERPHYYQYLDTRTPYQILLNDKPIGYINKGETKEFSIPEGNHTVKIKENSFSESPNFSIFVDDSSTKNIKIKDTYYLFRVTSFLVALCVLDAIIEGFSKAGYFGILSALGVIFSFFWFFKGEEKRLMIEGLDNK